MSWLRDPSVTADASVREEGEGMAMPDWSPRVDICEDDQEYLFTFELPEVKREGIKVTMENGVLTVAGERRLEQGGEQRTFHLLERHHGRFLRRFALPDDADPEQITADYKHGLLRVHVAKSEQAKPRQVKVT